MRRDKLLDRTDAKSGTAMSARLVSFDQKRTELAPGNSPGAGMGPALAAGDGDVRCVCLDWPDL